MKRLLQGILGFAAVIGLALAVMWLVRAAPGRQSVAQTNVTSTPSQLGGTVVAQTATTSSVEATTKLNPTATPTIVLNFEALRVDKVEKVETGPYQNIAFSPNDKMALVTKQYGSPYLLAHDKNVPTPASTGNTPEALPFGSQTALGDLWVLDLATGMERQLAEQIGRYTWSPDSTQVAYIAPTGTEGIAGALYVLNIADGETKQAAQVDFLGSDYTPQWLPTGEIVYVRDGQLWITTAVGGGEKALPTFKFYSWVAAEAGKEVNQKDPEAIIGFHFSPGGQRVAYLTRSHNGRAIARRLWLADANGGNAQLITEQAEGSYYEWSPDGQWLVFDTYRDVDDPFLDERLPSVQGLWSIRSDGSDVHLLHRTDNWQWIISPIWAPNSKIVMFVQSDPTIEWGKDSNDLLLVANVLETDMVNSLTNS